MNINLKGKFCILCRIFPDLSISKLVNVFLRFTSFLTCGTEACDHVGSHTSGALKAPQTFHEAFGHG